MANRWTRLINQPDRIRDLRQSDDGVLVARTLSAGDSQAFGELVHRHQGAVRGFLRQLCRDVALADDLAQDCFVRAWDKLASFGASGTLRAWLLRIAYREFLQHSRKNRRYRDVLVAYLHTSQTAIDPSGSDEWTDAERLLAPLSPEQRAVLILGHGYGMSHSEIAHTTGLALGTVKSHIRRGLAAIRSRCAITEENNER